MLGLMLFLTMFRNSPPRNASNATALPPAFAESAPEQAPSVAMLATNLCLLQVEHIKSGTARDFLDST